MNSSGVATPPGDNGVREAEPLPVRSTLRSRLRRLSLPRPLAACTDVPTMLSARELRLLYRIARDHYTNTGLIVDAGCFLGGSTMALGSGVRSNPRWNRDLRTPVIHSYDLFRVEDWTVGVYFPQGTPAGVSFEQAYRRFIAPLGEIVQVHAGNVMNQGWLGDPIEVLFIDLAKHWTVSDHFVQTFFPALIPGHSLVIQQDYLYERWNGWLPVTMEYFAEYFDIVGHTGTGSVVFKYVKEIPTERLREKVFAKLGLGAIEGYFDSAIRRFSGRQRQMLLASRKQLGDVLEDKNWPR